MKNKIYLFLFIVMTGSWTAFAQEKQEEQVDHSINGQFNELIESSNNFKNYKVISQSKIIQLQKNTSAEINRLNQRIDTANTTIDEQKSMIEHLQSNLSKTNNNLESVTAEKDEVAFLGMPTSKSTYRVIMWGIILVLALLMIFFIYQFKRNHALTKEAQKNLRESEAEFDEYKKKSLEKQQKLGRELQDERNKLARKKE